jgi:TRAP-type C4-dicarboxylate transport system substrate-binding protein
MQMNRRNMIGLTAAAALTTIAAPALAQEVTLRLHQFLPATADVPVNILDVWADKVEADSGGRIKIERYPAMQLGGTPPELVDQVTDGVVDIIWTVIGYAPGRFPQAEVFELPFFMGAKDARAASRAFYSLAEERMMDTDFKDLHVLGLWVHGPGMIHGNRPILSVADLQGFKVRAPNRMMTTTLDGLGATSVGMPVPAVPEALSKGVIDGAVVPWEVTSSLHLEELVNNHTEFGDAALYTTTFLFAMNKDSYAGLPDDLKAVIDANSGLEFSGFAGQVMEDGDPVGRAAAVAHGNTIHMLTPDQVAEWQAATKPFADAWVADMDARGLDGTGLVARARELMAANR